MPKNFSCEKCGARFESQRNLQRHLDRKTPCNPQIDPEKLIKEGAKYKCKKCGKMFNKAPNMYAHLSKYCKLRGASGDELRDRAIEHLRKRLKTLEARDEKAERIPPEELGEEGKAAAHASNTMVTGDGNIVVNGNVSNTIIIDQRQINLFGQESTSHIGRADIARILALVKPGDTVEGKLQGAQMAITEAALLVYADERAPENATCYMASERDSTVRVRGPRGWEDRPYKAVSAKVADTAVNVLFKKQPMDGPEMETSAAALRTLIDREECLRRERAPPMKVVFLRNRKRVPKHLEPISGESWNEMDGAASAACAAKPKAFIEVEAASIGCAAPTPAISKEEEDAIFEELYHEENVILRSRRLKKLTVAQALTAMRVEGLDGEEGEPGVERAQAVKILAACAACAAPWDDKSRREALRMAETLFWAIGHAGAVNALPSSLGPRARERAENISLWGQGGIVPTS